MKGGRTAPRDFGRGYWCYQCTRDFNEGGADCPPRLVEWQLVRYYAVDFNEGGADCPPRHNTYHNTERQTITSMKGGRTAPRDRAQLLRPQHHPVLQ